MARVRRTVYLVFHCHDGRFLDIPQLVRGVAEVVPMRLIHAISVLTGQEWPVTKEELELVLSVPSDRWVDMDGAANPDTVAELCRKGILLSDAADEQLAALRERDERLAAGHWNLYAAIYHFMTRWRDVDLVEGLDGELPLVTTETLEEFVRQRGRPPEAFHALDLPLAVRELPLPERNGALMSALRARKTTRGFDRSRTLGEEAFAAVLYDVFGCHGTAPIVGDIFAVKRTSPSGGGLHPVEAYPLVSGVEGIEPGLYHYNARDHTLELMERLSVDEAIDVATGFVAGQTYFGSAHVSFVLTARFPRTHWKYRRHQKAYTAILMDAAHLSQTLYLVCAELGLGAFVTAAINSASVDERLGLDGVEEGVVGICGCGPRPAGRQPLEPHFEPYVPRETRL